MVISTMGIPPCHTASAANFASCGEVVRMTGTIPIFSMRARTSCFFIKRHATFSLGSADDSGARSFHYVKNFVEGRHGGIARRGHRQRSMSGTAFYSPLSILTREKPINQTGGKRITAANTIKNLKILAIFGLIEVAVVAANGSPIISRRGGGFAKRGGDHFEGKIVQDFLNHLFEDDRIQCGQMLIHSWHFVTKGRREIFFIAEHHIHKGSNTQVNFLGALFSTDRSPQRIAIVEIV